MPTAYVRSVPASFDGALSNRQLPIDVGRAVDQHAAYVEALQEGGFDVEVLAGPEEHPDAPFIEDAALILGEMLVVTRPGVDSRRGEGVGIEQALAGRLRVERIIAPGTLEGGDVLRTGTRLYVGRSARTNQAGIDQLAALVGELGFEVVPVPVHGALHLKSMVTSLDPRTLVASRRFVDEDAFDGLDVLPVEAEEVNVLALPSGSVLVSASRPEVREVVEADGRSVITLDLSEFEKADGGLTCLSLRTGEG